MIPPPILIASVAEFIEFSIEVTLAAIIFLSISSLLLTIASAASSDSVLALCAIDLSGRPYLNYQADFTTGKIGEMDTEMIREFFYAVSYSAMMNLHLKLLEGGNNHHMAEALFKGFGKALHMSVSYEPGMTEVWSTKGSL